VSSNLTRSTNLDPNSQRELHLRVDLEQVRRQNEAFVSVDGEHCYEGQSLLSLLQVHELKTSANHCQGGRSKLGER